MSQSLVKILVHVVFSTKDRIALIPLELEDELYKYIHGIIENNSARLIIAGGTANHIHLLISIGKTDVPTLIGDVKRSTSVWMKKKGVEKFYWQKGYGAFSIGQSQVPVVSRYIGDQKEHHAKHDFKTEFRSLCEKYQVEIDERYAWD
jgi:putative transposase